MKPRIDELIEQGYNGYISTGRRYGKSIHDPEQGTHYIGGPDERVWMRMFIPPPPPKWMKFDRVFAQPTLGGGGSTRYVKAELDGD